MLPRKRAFRSHGHVLHCVGVTVARLSWIWAARAFQETENENTIPRIQGPSQLFSHAHTRRAANRITYTIQLHYCDRAEGIRSPLSYDLMDIGMREVIAAAAPNRCNEPGLARLIEKQWKRPE